MLSKKKVSPMPSINGLHCMTWRELAEADDYATSLIVDPFLGFKTHKMTDVRIRIPERVQDRLKNNILQFQADKDYELAYSKLTEDDVYIKRHLKNDPKFRQHIYRYLLLFDDRSGIQIRPCWRYASEAHVGAAIFATKDWPKGSRVDSLVGCIAELNYEEEVSFLRHKKNDYSVMYSSRKNRSQLWLGPAAYVNHDCQPNCKFTINCDGDARMSLEVRRDVKKGDEILIFYGKHFFDVNNSSCECFTCELLGTGFFSSSLPAPIQPLDAMTTVTQPPNMTTSSRSEDENVEEQNSGSKVASNNAIVQTLRERLQQIPARRLSNGVNRIFSEMQLLPSPHGGHLSDTTTDPLTPASMNGLLTKGLSTGLARRSTTNYSLRHTGSRMDRVKATIYSELAASLAANEQKPQISHPLRKKSPPPSTISHSLPPSNSFETCRRYSLRNRPQDESSSPSPATQKPVVLTTSLAAQRRRSIATVNNRPVKLHVQKRRFDQPQQKFADTNKIVSVQIVSESVPVTDQKSSTTKTTHSPLPPDLDPMKERTNISTSPIVLDDSPALLEREIPSEECFRSSDPPDCLLNPSTYISIDVEPPPPVQTPNIDSVPELDFVTWNFNKAMNRPPSPSTMSTSSTSTIAAAAAPDDFNIPPVFPLKSRWRPQRLTNYDAQLIASGSHPPPNNANNAYYLRERKPDVALSPACSVSSGDTCPALADPSPHRLLLVCKRSFQSYAASSSNSVISSSSDCEWFVDETRTRMREKKRRKESQVSLPEVFPGSSMKSSVGCSSRSSCLTCYSLAPEDHFDTPKILLSRDSWSSVELSPSPPHLQPATPPPPILGDAEDTEVDMKPLTVTIKRLGEQLYCIPPTPEKHVDETDSTLT